MKSISSLVFFTLFSFQIKHVLFSSFLLFFLLKGLKWKKTSNQKFIFNRLFDLDWKQKKIFSLFCRLIFSLHKTSKSCHKLYVLCHKFLLIFLLRKSDFHFHCHRKRKILILFLDFPKKLWIYKISWKNFNVEHTTKCVHKCDNAIIFFFAFFFTEKNETSRNKVSSWGEWNIERWHWTRVKKSFVDKAFYK